MEFLTVNLDLKFNNLLNSKFQVLQILWAFQFYEFLVSHRGKGNNLFCAIIAGEFSITNFTFFFLYSLLGSDFNFIVNKVMHFVLNVYLVYVIIGIKSRLIRTDTKNYFSFHPLNQTINFCSALKDRAIKLISEKFHKDIRGYVTRILKQNHYPRSLVKNVIRCHPVNDPKIFSVYFHTRINLQFE